MENNELQNIWKKIDSEISRDSKEELNRILVSKTKKSINKFLYYIGFSIVISLGFIAFLVITMINRWDDIYYRSNNLLLCFITIFSLTSAIGSFIFLNGNKLNLPLKEWLKHRIEKLSKWLRNKTAYYILPFMCTLVMLSIHVYYEYKPLIEVIKTEESIFGMFFGLIIGLIVAYIGLKKIKKQHLTNLEYLKDLYKQIDESDL